MVFRKTEILGQFLNMCVDMRVDAVWDVDSGCMGEVFYCREINLLIHPQLI